MYRRIRIFMDENKSTQPDGEKNYVVGSWDGNMERAIDNAVGYNRQLLVFWPQGFDLTNEDLEKEMK